MTRNPYYLVADPRDATIAFRSNRYPRSWQPHLFVFPVTKHIYKRYRRGDIINIADIPAAQLGNWLKIRENYVE